MRRFVRAQRGDPRALCYALRVVAANSAFALVLLGLTPERVEASPPLLQEHRGAPLFIERTGGANPLDPFDVGYAARPALGDLDADGDFDLIAGEVAGQFQYFRNGCNRGRFPCFAEVTASPLSGLDVGLYAAPALADLDGDGDLDLVSGEMGGAFRYFENTGAATSPAFIARTGSANPLDGLGVGGDSTPTLADLDADGDLDLLSGRYDGTFRYFENTGTRTGPTFVERTGTSNPFEGFGFDAGDYSAPALADLESDGDLDLVSGNGDGSFAYFENTGTSETPAFVARTGTESPLDGFDVGFWSAPALADLESDGDPDLISGADPPPLQHDPDDGTFVYFENVVGDFVARTGTENPLDGSDVGWYSAPALGDLDGDGDLDLVSGEYDGVFSYFENTGTSETPAFVARTGTENPLDGFDVGFWSAPALGDLDGDGDLDLVSGEYYGMFKYFENTGAANSPAFVARMFTANPFAGFDVGLSSKPTLVDLDGDVDLDLLSGNRDGRFAYFENTGTPASPAFVQRTGTNNPLDPFAVGYFSAPALADLDADGDLDLVAGQSSSFSYFENTGTRSAPVFVQRTGTDNPFRNFGVYRSAPALADLDADGSLDLVSGDRFGTFMFFERAGGASGPLFYGEATGAANPLDGIDAGDRSAPAVGDLDADGDADLVSGTSSGTFAYLENTGSTGSPAFVSRIGTENPLDGFDVGDDSSPALADLDADGDLDLVSGEYGGVFSYFENTGAAATPAFVERTGTANPFSCYSCNVGLSSAPTLGDLDADGDLDLVSSDPYGNFFVFGNFGSATSPVFYYRSSIAPPGVDPYSGPTFADLDFDGDLDIVSGEALGRFARFENTDPGFGGFLALGTRGPLEALDAGDVSEPAFVDLDADADLDLVSGNADGQFRVYFLPEPSTPFQLGAAVSLLALLDRWRRRREKWRAGSRRSRRGVEARRGKPDP